MGGRRKLTFVALIVVAGCRATVAPPPDDLLAPPDLTFIAVGPADLLQDDAGPDLFVCPKGAEICDDNCDNDGNSLIDGDDPACTPQLLVTSTTGGNAAVGTPQLMRVVLDAHPHTVAVNPNVVPPFAMATYNAGFSSSFYEVLYNGGGELDIPSPLLGVASFLNVPPFATRDICTFNGELIVIEPRSGPPAQPPQSTLHRMKADGMTELTPSVVMAGIASACASDGEKLYVSFYQVPTPSQIEVFTKGDDKGPVDSGTANAIGIPLAIVNSGGNRLFDFAYVKKGGGFIGLFADGKGGSVSDGDLTSGQLTQFDFDGGVGSVYDAGVWNGVGEFLP